MTYQEQLKHPKWQQKRLEVLEANEFTCSSCGSKDKQLHVHHPRYKKGAKIWEYEDGELECLCVDCHSQDHEIMELINDGLAQLGYSSKMQLLGYLDSMITPVIRHKQDESYCEGFADRFRNNTKSIIHMISKSF